MNGELIEQFVDKKSIEALPKLLESTNDKEIATCAVQLSTSFGSDNFASIASDKKDAEKKLISSFNHNLVLLIQKTWVEKSDEELKAKVLYQLEQFCKDLEEKAYAASYTKFFQIVDEVVYLMFGSMTKSGEFDEYALRIDPEFGIFWWYMKSLPRDAAWSDSKSRIAVLLGMFFLANY